LSTPQTTRPVAVVTGGARGIGLAIAKWFLAHDYRVALFDIESATLNQTDSDLNNPDNVLALRCDVSKPEQVQASVDAVAKKFGRIDALVNNAGVAVFKPIGETSFEEFRHVLGTNLDGAFLCSQACVPHMKKSGGGAIVNTASVAGLVGAPKMAAYAASKHAVLGLTKSAAVEYGRKNIRVNAVCPGVIQTAMYDRAVQADPQVAAAIEQLHPVGRIGRPEEVAAVVLWLCSDASSFVTGLAHTVDGGMTSI
jgi:NAD(P)-dependent dehydrogenase (short-subunit alcohol dehydrogenase family)